MHRIILTSIGALLTLGVSGVFAADMPVKAPPVPAVVPIYNWNGFYIGANVGIGIGSKDWNFVNVPAGARIEHDVTGPLAGGQVGFNFQTGAWVFGVEGMFDWANLKGDSACPNAAFNCVSKVRSLASATGRIGYAWGPALIYAKGGAAWASDRYRTEIAATRLEFDFASETRTGWTAGGGIEYGFGPNWSLRFAYDYYDFGTRRVDFFGSTGVFSDTREIEQHFHTVTAGVNYRFNWMR